MDANHQEILDNLDEKEPRSRLAPYRDLILELRRRNRTYREIQKILSDRCQIGVSISTLHDFLFALRRKDSKQRKQQATEHDLPKNSERPRQSARIGEDISDMKDAEQRIAAFKHRTTSLQTDVPRFEYDPSQPLCLSPKANNDKG